MSPNPPSAPEGGPSKAPLEILPIGFDCSRVDNIELRRAYIETVKGLYQGLNGVRFGEGKMSNMHLEWMCKTILDSIQTMPVDKIGRWVGFIQGVMAAHNLIDVDEERDRTRPLFEAALRVRPAPLSEPSELEEAAGKLAEALERTKTAVTAGFGKAQRDHILAQAEAALQRFAALKGKAK